MTDRFERWEEEQRRKKAGKPKKKAKKAKAPKLPEPPWQLADVLDWYNQIRAGMGRGMEVEPLSHQEIKAFRDLHHLEDVMESYDILLLRRLDGEWFATLPKVTKKKEQDSRPTRVGRG